MKLAVCTSTLYLSFIGFLEYVGNTFTNSHSYAVYELLTRVVEKYVLSWDTWNYLHM